jgi:hypothetical protein
MLAGLVKLSESVQQVVNDVKALERWTPLPKTQSLN